MSADPANTESLVREAAGAVPVGRHVDDVLVTLRDGSMVLIRPVDHDDSALLEDGFSRLSAESRRLRFLVSKTRLSKAELEYFTHIDHHDREAIGARDASDGRGLGIAQFFRDPENPEVAEVAFAVVDDWQGRGLGTELLSRLFARAHEEGVRRFTALVDQDNKAVRALMQGLGAQMRATDHAAGAVTYEITPPPARSGAEP